MEDQNTQMGGSMPSGAHENGGSKKGIVWVIILVIAALIVVALATGGKSADEPLDYTDENFISENASDEVADIEADLNADLNFESLDSELENI